MDEGELRGSSRNAVILVCDDDPNARAIADGALSALGFDVLQAEDGREAMEICGRALPDVIVLDLMMPHVSGTEFVQWLRGQSLPRYVPVLVVTARHDVEHKIGGLSAGADDYLTKPYHYRELQARVEALLRVRDLTEEIAAQKLSAQAAQASLAERERELSELENNAVSPPAPVSKLLDALAQCLSLSADTKTKNEGLVLVERLRAESGKARTASRRKH